MTSFIRLSLLAVFALPAWGCGLLVDSDRIVVARMDGEPIRRGDLSRILREMDDEERPIIQTRGDLLQALNRYIDGRIKEELGEKLKESGELEIPRARAEQVYFEQHPEDRAVRQIQDPSALGYSPAEFRAMKDLIESRIDDVEAELYGDASVMFEAQRAARDGLITIEEEEYEQEYRLRKDEIKSLERISFTAIQIPSSMDGAAAEAAAIKKRIDEGESFDALVEEYGAKNPQFVLQSEMENNPSLAKFQTFWHTLHGAEEGKVYGPVFLPEYEMAAQLRDGRTMSRAFPAALLVLRVDSHQPSTTLSLEEAKQYLSPEILIRKMMQRLREQHGVEIYPDQLPDPSGYGDQFEEFMV